MKAGERDTTDGRTDAALPRVLVTRPMLGICHMQVCAVADATDEEILAVCNAQNMSGTSNGWSVVCRKNDKFWGRTAPIKCSQDPKRKHFMVAC